MDEKERRNIRLSVNLVDLLDTGGWFNKKECRRSEIILLERIIGITHLWYKTFAGSFAEGSDFSGSDQDFMIHIPRAVAFTVGSENQASEFSDSTCFIMLEEGHRPCYPVLKLMGMQDIEKGFLFQNRWKLERFLEKDLDGNFLISSKQFTDALTQMTREIKMRNIESFYTHGPCATTKFSPESSDDNPREIDATYTVKCIGWPTSAKEWMNRNRTKWPPQHLVSEIVKLGCSLVPLGDPLSPHNHLEWRLSFLLGERMLVWNFNKTQFYSYLFLKMMKNKFIEPKYPGLISSYHLKTIVFWNSEESDSRDCLVQFLTECIDRLSNSVSGGILQHYFIPKNNLYLGKLDTLDVDLQEISDDLSALRSNIFEIIHQCLDIPCIPVQCPICGSAPASPSSLLADSDGLWKSLYALPHKSSAFIVGQFDTHFRRLDLVDLQKVKQQVDNLPATVLNEHEGLLKSIFYSRYGIEIHKQTFSDFGFTREQLDIALNEAFKCLKIGVSKDELAGHLQLATFLYVRGDFEKSQSVVLGLFKDKIIIYEGICSKRKTIKLQSVTKGIEKKSQERFSVADLSMAYDVAYSPTDGVCVPYALSCECVLFDDVNDDVRVHPTVYMHFLLILINKQQGRSKEEIMPILRLLSEEVQNARNGDKFDTSLNLLGYCYYLVDEAVLALQCFRESYHIRKSVKNPCLYHSLVLLMKTVKKNHKDD